MTISRESGHNEKAIRLVEYLLRLASLRAKLVRDIADYEKVLWISEVPHEGECFTQAWGCDEEHGPDKWLQVQNRREPELPAVPSQCKDWVNQSSLRNKGDLPELVPEITRKIENPDWQDGTDEPEFIPRAERIEDHPEVQRRWERYVEEEWLPWTEDHNIWESVHKVYSTLFAIHQEQIRLGEEYELVLGLGLLAWQTPTGQRVRRHLIVADANLEFEAQHQRFTVEPHSEGTKLRPELDMLDIQEQPPRAEERAKAGLIVAEDIGSADGEQVSTPLDDPWDKSIVEGVLEALAHSFSSTNAAGEPVHGEYYDRLERAGLSPSPKPIIEYAPALILRKRSSKGLTETLKGIKARLEAGEGIPDGFVDLAEIRPKHDRETDVGQGQPRIEFDGEVFFPKSSNEEQRRIVDKIRAESGVLVQGPPGTGKSHTIANLISHLLATGQRTLITAKTPRALQVLEGLVPSELRPLCINLLGSGLEERRSLESSVNGILRKNEDWKEDRAKRERTELEENVRKLREEKAKVNRRLRDIRESETHSQSIAEGTYRGTAARIAEAVNRDRNVYEWFTDNAPLEQPCPIHEDAMRRVLAALRHFTPEKRRELNLVWPEALPSAERFVDLVENEAKAIEEEHISAGGADERTADLLSKSDPAPIEAMCRSLSEFQGSRRNLMASPHNWMRDALRDVLGGNSSLLRELSRVTRDTISSIEKLVSAADGTSIEFPDSTDIRTLREDACKLKEHMGNRGKLGWGPFRPTVVKERLHVIKAVRVGGRPCSAVEHFSVLADVLYVRIECEKAWRFWVGRSDRTQGPYALQLATLKSLCDALENTLSLEGLIEKCREMIRQCPTIGEPVWSDESQVQRLIASCRLAEARHRKRLAAEEIKDIETLVSSIVAKKDAHPVTNDLLLAIRDRNMDGFAQSANRVQDLEQERQRLLKVDEYLSNLRRLFPSLTDELKRTCADLSWDGRLQHITEAWHWAQARFWIEQYIRQDDLPALVKRSKQVEDEINSIIAKLASLYAWSFCFSRLKEDHRRNMKAWQKNVSKITKSGTGKQDFFHRKEAQKNLNNCREAIPAWVMPLHRLWDTVDPEPGMFDMVIIDEASQCGFEALPLFYLAKKILIVGDDKQISPEAEGVKLEAVTQLINQFLYDFEHKASFNINRSLFDQGELRYSSSHIVLREHFRCMPEIIRFSNDLCYSDTPLIPLRQYGPDRLPPLEHVFVSGGYREGSNSRTINRPEAEAIVRKIGELCGDSRYDKKSIGVVVLQGEAQAALIESQLLERLGAEEMQRRRLVCGNAYSFQGDERDIMLLSLVAATNAQIGTLTRPADERRFNVAASRARDMMILFHSVTCDDLSTSCLRRKLLEFFENTTPQQIAGIDRDELERRASQDNRSIVNPPIPFESWFELDVALEMLRKGFVVSPQFEVAGKWIDLVVEGGQARLAVECDGDTWHGSDRYDADMQRQRQLERCGWEFFRVRESAFYANRGDSLKGLWRALEDRGILPHQSRPADCSEPDTEEDVSVEADSDTSDTNDEDLDDDPPLSPVSEDSSDLSSRRSEDITSTDIQDAILRVLSQCPNQSCTEESLTARVLRELHVLTRGNPRLEFARRVVRSVTTLEKRGRIKRYRAKNKRIRLIKSESLS